MFELIRRFRRRRVTAQPFPREWERILESNCGFYHRLPREDRNELKRHVQVFMAEKYFEGCGGLKMTDEIRLTIAGTACLMLLHRKHRYYRDLVTVLVYPSRFVVEHVEVNEFGIEARDYFTNLGESWERGNVILAWDSAHHGALDPKDGLNVILHEFAHQIDAEDGYSEGAPPLENAAARKAWASVMQAEYERLQSDVDAGRETVLDPYGLENPAEFFAVSVEAFFELPLELKAERPRMYEQMQSFFKQDPASWDWSDLPPNEADDTPAT
jgi:MtfA peptidase